MNVLLGWVLVASLRGTLDVSDRTEVRIRDAPGVGVVADLETVPIATLKVTARRWSLGATYAAQGTLRQFNDDRASSRDIYQTGQLALGVQVTRRTTLRLEQQGSYGYIDFGALGYTRSGTTGPLPTSNPLLNTLPPGRIRVAGTRSGGGVESRLSHQLTSTLLGFYSYSSGLGNGKNVYPAEEVGFGQAALAVAASPRDAMIGQVSAAVSRFEYGPNPVLAPEITLSDTFRGPRSELYGASEMWRRRFGHDNRLSLGFGVTVTRSKYGPDQSIRTQVFPTSEGELNLFVWHNRVQWRNSYEIEPMVDRITGRIDPRLSFTSAAEATYHKRWSTLVSLGFVRSLASSGPFANLTLWTASASIVHKPKEFVQFESGVRFLYQSTSAQYDSAFSDQALLAGFFAVSFVAPRVRL